MIIINYWISQFQVSLDSPESSCVHGSEPDGHPWSSPGEVGSGVTASLLELISSLADDQSPVWLPRVAFYVPFQPAPFF
jgi:hypothetical protein